MVKSCSWTRSVRAKEFSSAGLKGSSRERISLPTPPAPRSTTLDPCNGLVHVLVHCRSRCCWPTCVAGARMPRPGRGSVRRWHLPRRPWNWPMTLVQEDAPEPNRIRWRADGHASVPLMRETLERSSGLLGRSVTSTSAGGASLGSSSMCQRIGSIPGSCSRSTRSCQGEQYT